MFKYIIKIIISIVTILAFIPLICFSCIVIEQAIAEVDYLAVFVLGILALMLVALAIAIIYGILGGNDGI